MVRLMEVHEVSKITGVSIRTLQYYDSIDLLKPACYTEVGYRLYDENALERLQQILLFKELEFPLKEIKDIIDAPHFDRNKAHEQQIELLMLKKEHLENLINYAQEIKMLGVKKIDFSAFDTKKIDEYTKQAKEKWENTPEYKEFEKNSKIRTNKDQEQMTNDFMYIFFEFGQMKKMSPDSDKVQTQVKKLQNYISEHFYHCTNLILHELGKMYSGGGQFTENIDKAGGTGTADFTAKAIEVYCIQ